jgi:hypothetical protein
MVRTTGALLAKAALYAALALMVSSVAITSSAQAAPRPSVKWAFTSSNVDAQAPISATYQTSGIRSGSVLTFERQFGTAKVWKAVANFHVASGASTAVNLPADPLGAYMYRVVAVTGRKVVAQTAVRALFAYGNVSLLTICQKSTSGNARCSPGSVQLTNSIIYNYQVSTYANANTSPGQTVITFPVTSCRSASLTIVVGRTANDNGPFPGSSATIQIAQSASDPQLITVPDTTQQAFNFNLDGGPFDVDDWFTTNGNYYDDHEYVYLSGNFSCYTLNGLR